MNTPPRAQVKRTLADLLPRYMANRAKDLEQSRSALQSADFATLRSIGHRLKGSGSGYGFHEITTLGTALQEAAVRLDSQTAGALIESLEEYLRQVQIDLI